MDLKLVSTAAHQVFGHWYGNVTISDGQVSVEGVLGFAEDVRNRW